MLLAGIVYFIFTVVRLSMSALDAAAQAAL
jgi:hypothetical protein